MCVHLEVSQATCLKPVSLYCRGCANKLGLRRWWLLRRQCTQADTSMWHTCFLPCVWNLGPCWHGSSYICCLRHCIQLLANCLCFCRVCPADWCQLAVRLCCPWACPAAGADHVQPAVQSGTPHVCGCLTCSSQACLLQSWPEIMRTVAPATQSCQVQTAGVWSVIIQNARVCAGCPADSGVQGRSVRQ
jgi:hypothetical protein